MAIKQSTIDFCVDRFKVKPEEVVAYNSGSSYSTIWVSTKEAADKVRGLVQKEGRTANGGMFHGMPLGSITDHEKRRNFSVTC